MSRKETQADLQMRLEQERRCRDIAETVRARLRPDEGFLLATMNIGPKDTGALSYVASVRREDAARALVELLDTWAARDGIQAEPGPGTMTMLRELVHEQLSREQPKPEERSIVTDARACLRARTTAERGAAALMLAARALTLYSLAHREALSEA